MGFSVVQPNLRATFLTPNYPELYVDKNGTRDLANNHPFEAIQIKGKTVSELLGISSSPSPVSNTEEWRAPQTWQITIAQLETLYKGYKGELKLFSELSNNKKNLIKDKKSILPQKYQYPQTFTPPPSPLTAEFDNPTNSTIVTFPPQFHEIFGTNNKLTIINNGIQQETCLDPNIIKVGSSQIASSEVSSNDICTSQVSSSQVGVNKSDTSQISLFQIGTTQVAVNDVGVSQTNPTQIHVPQVSSVQDNTAKNCSSNCIKFLQSLGISNANRVIGAPSIWHSGMAENGIFSCDIGQLGIKQINVNQNGIIQINANQVSIPQISTNQVVGSQVSLFQIGTPQIGINQVATPETSTVKISSAQVDIAQVSLFDKNLAQINPTKISLTSSIPFQQFFNFHKLPLASTNTYKNNPLNFWQTFTDPTNPFDINLQLVDLPTGQLAEAQITQFDPSGRPNGGTLLIDHNANGVGWYIDPTPLDNSEFSQTLTNTAFRATTNSPAAGHYDLLTTLLHEMGHLSGFISGYNGYDSHIQTLNSSQLFVGDNFSATLTPDKS